MSEKRFLCDGTYTDGVPCDYPDGLELTEVPRPRHAWSDVLCCPNGCGRAWLILKKPPKEPPPGACE